MDLVFYWEVTISGNVREGGDIFLSSLESEMDAIASAMESYAKVNHPWQNRTYAAESTFTARLIEPTVIEIAHGVPYGIFLEVMQGGRLGIIPATLDFGAGEIMNAANRAWSTAWRFP